MKKILFIVLLSFLFITECHAQVLEGVTHYYKTTEKDGIFKSNEITEEEYNNVSDIELLNNTTNTEYKSMQISRVYNKISLKVEWKKTPKYKSYDVIAIMGDGVTFVNATLEGRQNNDTSTIINYNKDSQNTKIFDNGIGISMNLVDNATKFKLSLVVDCNLTTSGTIYGNYRHATSNVTLSNSKDYTLQNGSIIFNNSNINSKYDSISYVSLNV